MIFYTADHHFGHRNIIEYANRPFANLEEMHRTMVKRWNERVTGYDYVYHLADFCLDTDGAYEYFSMLNGEIFVLGNMWHHDRRWIYTYADRYEQSGMLTMAMTSATGQPVRVISPMHVVYSEDSYPLNSLYPSIAGYPPYVLCHYPLREWDRKHYGAIHLHGHSHGNTIWAKGERALDVGVDSNDFYPWSAVEVYEHIRKKIDETK